MICNCTSHLVTSMATLAVKVGVTTTTIDSVVVWFEQVFEVGDELLTLQTTEALWMPHQIGACMMHLSVDVELSMKDFLPTAVTYLSLKVSRCTNDEVNVIHSRVAAHLHRCCWLYSCNHCVSCVLLSSPLHKLQISVLLQLAQGMTLGEIKVVRRTLPGNQFQSLHGSRGTQSRDQIWGKAVHELHHLIREE